MSFNHQFQDTTSSTMETKTFTEESSNPIPKSASSLSHVRAAREKKKPNYMLNNESKRNQVLDKLNKQ